MTYVIGDSKTRPSSPLNDLISSLFSMGPDRRRLWHTSPKKEGEPELSQQSLEQAENYCKDCNPPSPMVCVERCDVWKVKNEIVEVGSIVREAGHTMHLLNAVKNARRLRVVDALRERPLSVKELQNHLRSKGYRHSRSTITDAYLKPLTKAGLVKEDGARYRLTFYGRKVLEALQRLDYSNALPIHSCCYEEAVMKELSYGPKTFEELATLVSPKSLSRILMRLRRRELMARKHRGDYVFYHRVKKIAAVNLSPTEKRVFEAIPDMGIPARALSRSVGITRRRTYKYLRRLMEKKLVLALRTRKTYELTSQGTKIAAVLDEITKLASQSLSAPIPAPQRLP